MMVTLLVTLTVTESLRVHQARRGYRERESLSVETRLQLSAVSSTVSVSHCD